MINWDFNDNDMCNGKYNDNKPCNKKYDDKKYNDNKPCDKKDDDKKDDRKKDDCCCCSEGFRKALSLLNDPKISEFIEFNKFAIIGKNYTAGGSLLFAVTNGHNLLPTAEEFEVTLQCIDCNLVKTSPITRIASSVSNQPEFPIDAPLNYWSLCDIDVAQIQVDEDLIVTNATDNPCAKIRNWNDFKAYFRSLLDKNNPQCDHHKDCKDCNDCCCAEDIFNQFDLCTFGNQGSIVNLTAGEWRGEGLEILGRVGCILVLTNNNIDDTTEDPYIFFVCLNSIGGIYNV